MIKCRNDVYSMLVLNVKTSWTAGKINRNAAADRASTDLKHRTIMGMMKLQGAKF